MSGCSAAYFLLCYSRFSPKPLEISNILFSIIVGLTTYIGHPKIPFYIDSQIYKIIYFFNIPYFIIIILLNIVFLLFRFFNVMNNSLYLWGYSLSVAEIYVALFGIITNLINDSIIISNIKYYQELSMKKKSQKFRLITPEELLYTKIIFPVILFIWVNIILVALTDNLLINMKISASYHTYELAIEDEQKFTREQSRLGGGNDNVVSEHNEQNEHNENNNHNIVVINTSNNDIVDNDVVSINNNMNNNNEQTKDLLNQNNNLNDNINNQSIKTNNHLNNNSNIQDNNPINILINQDTNLKNNNLEKNNLEKNNLENNKKLFVGFKDNIHASVNVLLEENNMEEDLKNNEDVKY